MPIHEYECQNCGEKVELLLGHRAETPQCPKCGSTLLKKLISAPYVMTRESVPHVSGTCCGREERCSTPHCETGESCRRDW